MRRSHKPYTFRESVWRQLSGHHCREAENVYQRGVDVPATRRQLAPYRGQRVGQTRNRGLCDEAPAKFLEKPFVSGRLHTTRSKKRQRSQLKFYMQRRSLENAWASSLLAERRQPKYRQPGKLSVARGMPPFLNMKVVSAAIRSSEFLHHLRQDLNL